MPATTVWSISILAALLPTVVYVLILWWLDHYEKEPRGLLLVAFLWGALPAAVLSILAEHSLSQPLVALGESAAGWVSSTVAAPIIEELTKGLAVLLLFMLAQNEFDGVLDGIVYGATIGFGFAMTENAIYFVRSFEKGGVGMLTMVVILRAFIFGMNHALFTSVFGAALGHARTLARGARRWTLPVLGLIAGIALHSIHNLFAGLSGRLCFSVLLSVASDWAGVLVILVVIILAWRQEQRWIMVNLRSEVEGGLLSADEYSMLASYRRRASAWWQALNRSGLAAARRVTRFTQLATELAFKLQQGDEKRAARLRGQIAELRRGG